MIIQCKKCLTKFRFEDENMTGRGVWLRCTRCGHVFFEENQNAAAPQIEPAPEQTKGELPDVNPPELTEIEIDAGGRPDEEPADPPTLESGNFKKFLQPKALVLLFVVLVLLAGVALFAVFPQDGKRLVAHYAPWIPLKQLGLESKAPIGEGIDFLEVRERFVKNWILGDLMVIQGVAVNRNSQPVSKISVIARLVNDSGEFVSESQSYCGDLLTDDELLNMTEKEIRKELGNPAGSDVPNSGIANGANIPFMVVFQNPPKKVTEYVVELGSMEKAGAK